MRALQELPTVPSGPVSPPSPDAWRRMLRCVIGVIGGVLWWGALLRLAVRPDTVGPWQSALAAGGWSLGLIPLHAVPARAARSRPAPATGGATAT